MTRPVRVPRRGARFAAVVDQDCRARIRTSSSWASALPAGPCASSQARRERRTGPHVGAAVPAALYAEDVEELLLDGIVMLKEDHKTVEKLFKQFEKAGDDAHAEKRKIAHQVIEELTAHT